jgi:hypothetical protein
MLRGEGAQRVEERRFSAANKKAQLTGVVSAIRVHSRSFLN